MKKINKIIMLLMLSFNINNFAQVVPSTNNPLHAQFVGTWEYNLPGNQIFRLIIWEDSEPNPHSNEYFLRGHYELVEVNINSETLIYTSNPPDVANGLKWPYAFGGRVNLQDDGTYIFSAQYREVHPTGSGLRGWSAIKRVSSCLGCPAKISWKIERTKGLRFNRTGSPLPTDFTVPNNIELTKVN
jgi:hypothetical protein